MQSIIITLIWCLTLVIELGRLKKWMYLIPLALTLLWFSLQRGNSTTFSLKTIVFSLIWLGSWLCLQFLKKIHTTALKKLDQEVRATQDKIQSLEMSDTILQEEANTLEGSLSEKEALYGSLEELNQTLEFSKTVEVFSQLISRLTHFEEGWLLVENLSEETAYRPLCYQLFRNEKPLLKKGKLEDILNKAEKEILELSKKSGTPVFISDPDNDARLTHPVTPPLLASLTGIGLFHEEGGLGCLILSGCKKRDLEVLEILAIQLAMEIEKSLLYEKVRRLSIIDGLTQIYLRRHLISLLEDELNRLKNQGKSCSLLMIDIDHFKHFNDGFGHLAGDILLKELSSRLQINLRAMDLVGRFGGEEFLIALPETTIDEAATIAERIRRDVEAMEFRIYGKILKLTLSMGLASYPEDAKNLNSLIEMADSALYQAKNSGRNQIRRCQKT